jgi:hypothetical protein
MGPINDKRIAEAEEIARGEFGGGARSVLIRSPAGSGFGGAAVLFAAAEARRGRCLVLCPRVLQDQFEAQLARLAPDVRPGRWDSGAALVLADALQVDRRAAGAAPERFDAVVVEEFHPDQFSRVRGVLARFPEARVLEVIRMPKPFPGATRPDAEVDLSDEPALALGGPGR